jgi:hypothetical protein
MKCIRILVHKTHTRRDMHVLNHDGVYFAGQVSLIPPCGYYSQLPHQGPSCKSHLVQNQRFFKLNMHILCILLNQVYNTTLGSILNNTKKNNERKAKWENDL